MKPEWNSNQEPEICEEGAMKEGAQEISGEGAQHLAMLVFILALSLLLQLITFSL